MPDGCDLRGKPGTPLAAHLDALPAGAGAAEAPLVARVAFRGSGRAVQAVRRRLLRWVEKLRETEDEGESSAQEGGKGQPMYALTVVLCRTDAT